MDHKIANFTEDVALIQKLSDYPNAEQGLSADQLKELFDEAPTRIKNFINNVLVPAVQALQSGSITKEELQRVTKEYIDVLTLDVLRFSEQDLSKEQQAQARKNIGADIVDEYGNIRVKANDAQSVNLDAWMEGYTPHLDLMGSDGDEPVVLGNLKGPSNSTDAANKQYVDNATADYYHTERTPFENADNLKTEDIYELYLGLGAVENTLCDFSGEETNLKEFVFTIGDYNTSTVWGIPDEVHKPTFLVTSGIHGDEITAVLATYRFFADLANGKNLPTYLAEGAIFKVVPLVNPNGFDLRTRGNANGVNLNRNFDYQWQEYPLSAHDDGEWNNYSGESVASEAETQAITNWLFANKDAAVLFDMHSSTYLDEYAGLMGSKKSLAVTKAKKVALRGLDKVVPYWKSLLDDYSGITFHYSSCLDGYNGKPVIGGLVYYAAEGLGIPGFAVECVSNTTTKVIDGIRKITEERPTADIVAIGAEVLGNMLLETYKQYAMDVSTAKKYSTIADALTGSNETEDGTVIAYETASMLNIVLTEDVTATETIEVTKDCTLHLNGRILSFATGKHISLTSGKLTINGTVPGSEIAKAIANGTSEHLVSVVGVEGTELHLFGGVYFVSGTASSAIIPIRGESGKVAKMTLSGCTVNMENCSGLAVYGVQIVDDAAIDNCVFNMVVDKSDYPAYAITSRNIDDKIAIRNTAITFDGGDNVSKAQLIYLSPSNSIVENCTIRATMTKSGAVCNGIEAANNATDLTINNCDIDAICAVSMGAATGATVRINGGHYQGSNKALDLTGTVYINGEAVNGATYTAKEYDFD